MKKYCSPILKIGSNNKHKGINREKIAQKCTSGMLEPGDQSQQYVNFFLNKDFFLGKKLSIYKVTACHHKVFKQILISRRDCLLQLT